MPKEKMRICIIGGDHPRHFYYANKISESCNVVARIVQKRENFMPVQPKFLDSQDEVNFIRHFRDRDLAERNFFGHQPTPTGNVLLIDKVDLNSQLTSNFIKKINPNLVLVFGCGIILEPLASVLPKNTINLHLGLSPRYRGSATLFWPFYFLEPNYSGSTFHYIIDEPDAGDIIHQTVPQLNYNDKIHDVACKVVIRSAEEAIRLIQHLKEHGEWKTHKQKSTGKMFLSTDFRPEHLRQIYNNFDNNIVDLYLNGGITSRELRIFDQFRSK